MRDSLLEQPDDGNVQSFGSREFDALCVRERMETGAVQSFVDIYIAKTSEEALVKQERLEVASARSQAGGENERRKFERVGAEAGGRRVDEPERAELANIVIEQTAAIFKLEHGARVGAGIAMHQQRASHAELNVDEAVIELDQDLFAVAAYAANHAIHQTGRIVA